MDLSVVVPFFNSESYAAQSLKTLQFLSQNFTSFEIIAVNDGSSDGTEESFASVKNPKIQFVRLPVNSGKFAALAAGFQRSSGRCKVFVDGDLPYDLQAIPYIARLVLDRGFHLVIGDRSLIESEYYSLISWKRRLGSKFFSFLVRMLVTGGLFDTQCGIKGFRGDVADALFAVSRDRYFSGDVELLYVALKHNLEIKRIPVRLMHQTPSSFNYALAAARILRRIMMLRICWNRGFYDSQELLRISNQCYWSAEDNTCLIK